MTFDKTIEAIPKRIQAMIKSIFNNPQDIACLLVYLVAVVLQLVNRMLTSWVYDDIESL